MNLSRLSLAGALALSLLTAGAAFADPAPGDNGGGGGAPTGGGPVLPTDTKQFGDWFVRCYPVASQSPCDMFEYFGNKQNGQRILSVSIAYVPASDKYVIQIAVPLGMAIQKGVYLISDAYTSPMLHYRRCDRQGCYVEMFMENDVITALSGSAGPARIRIVLYGNDKPIDLPLSLNGFSDAHSAMQDLARKKTGKPAPADATPPPAPDAGTTPAPAPDNSTPAPDATTPAPSTTP